jgi:hypothetical protein
MPVDRLARSYAMSAYFADRRRIKAGVVPLGVV